MTATNYLTATETQLELKEGSISLPEIVRDHQKRFELRDKDVHAWVAIRQAELIAEIDDEKGNSKQGQDKILLGVTIGVKDTMCESSDLSMSC